MTAHSSIAWAALVLIGALIVVGTVSDGIIHHVVQSAPAWTAVLLGFRGSRWARWFALPVFLVWLLLFAMIWLFVAGYPSPIDGTFSQTEVAMTVLGGVACIAGFVAALRVRGPVPWPRALAVFALMTAAQIGAVAAGLTPLLVSDKALLARL